MNSIFVVGAGAVQHDLRRAKFVSPVNQHYFLREFRQKRRFLHRRIAAAYNDDVPVTEERAVARGASGNAVAQQITLGLNAKHSRRCSGRDDQRFALVGFFPGDNRERPLAQIY